VSAFLLSSPACKWHATSYFAVRVLSGSTILFTWSKKQKDFWKKLLNKKSF